MKLKIYGKNSEFNVCVCVFMVWDGVGNMMYVQKLCKNRTNKWIKLPSKVMQNVHRGIT